ARRGTGSITRAGSERDHDAARGDSTFAAPRLVGDAVPRRTHGPAHRPGGRVPGSVRLDDRHIVQDDSPVDRLPAGVVPGPGQLEDVLGRVHEDELPTG